MKLTKSEAAIVRDKLFLDVKKDLEVLLKEMEVFPVPYNYLPKFVRLVNGISSGLKRCEEFDRVVKSDVYKQQQEREKSF